ncbi:MAG: hypothetical protein ACI4I0_05940 [Acutalibacteraceae bacterium]
MKSSCLTIPPDLTSTPSVSPSSFVMIKSISRFPISLRSLFAQAGIIEQIKRLERRDIVPKRHFGDFFLRRQFIYRDELRGTLDERNRLSP